MHYFMLFNLGFRYLDKEWFSLQKNMNISHFLFLLRFQFPFFQCTNVVVFPIHSFCHVKIDQHSLEKIINRMKRQMLSAYSLTSSITLFYSSLRFCFLEYSRLVIVFSPQPLHLEKGKYRVKDGLNIYFFFAAPQQYNIISKSLWCKDDPKCPMLISGLHS